MCLDFPTFVILFQLEPDRYQLVRYFSTNVTQKTKFEVIQASKQLRLQCFLQISFLFVVVTF